MRDIADEISHAYQSGFNDGYEKGQADAENYAQHCGDTDEPFTNADRIRSMSDEELDDLLSYICDAYYMPSSGWLNWLKQEAE